MYNAVAQTLEGHNHMRFTDAKSDTLNLRILPTFKKVLKEVEDHDQRNTVKMLEVLLCECYERNGIAPEGQKNNSPPFKRARSNRKMHVGAA
ncbi:hypothetical protein GCM10022278_37700 [Allohahella marinimesophila]|uniref:Uncharacterized protein n=1 Tax=Allohahella marinimesophila TaxID=1054972 RepID=A0ABP7Q6K9_9GAMM